MVVAPANVAQPAPAWAVQGLQTFPPSYLYVQYNDDPDLQALVTAQNTYQQQYLDAFNALNLPIYTKDPIAGPLLDWVAQGLYGIQRPVFGYLVSNANTGGQYNTAALNTIPYNGQITTPVYAYSVATDDQYRRVITWNIYKGDGYQFNATWLKRRILRFLTGNNGIDPGIDQTYLIGVAFGSSNTVTITCDPSLPNISLLSQAIAGGFLMLPFQYTYSVS